MSRMKNRVPMLSAGRLRLGFAADLASDTPVGGLLHVRIGSLSALRHVVFAIELPIALPAQSRDVSPPDAPLLLRMPEPAKLLGVSRSAWYQFVASGQVPLVRVGLPLANGPV